jgi:pyridoxal 5'-phosphate synthase pdxT subunit
MVKPRTIGVLALQGDFSLHRNSLERLGASAPKIRRPSELESCDGLVVPGGESTTFGKMLRETGLFEAIRSFAGTRPVMGTCAGLIALAARIANDGIETLGLIDVEVERNAYGRQVDSFVADVRVPALGSGPGFEGVFIRAPKIRSVGKGTESVGFLGPDPVMVRNDRILAMTFHPELTDDLRIHRYFIEEFAGGKK